MPRILLLALITSLTLLASPGASACGYVQPMPGPEFGLAWAGAARGALRSFMRSHRVTVGVLSAIRETPGGWTAQLSRVRANDHARWQAPIARAQILRPAGMADSIALEDVEGVGNVVVLIAAEGQPGFLLVAYTARRKGSSAAWMAERVASVYPAFRRTFLLQTLRYQGALAEHVAALASGDAAARTAALYGLTAMGPSAASAAPAVARLLAPGVPRRLRGQALEALIRIRDRRPEVLSAIEACTRGQDAPLARRARQILVALRMPTR